MFVLIDDLLLASILLCPGDPAVNAPRFIGLPVGAIVNDVQIVDFMLGVCKIFSVIGPFWHLCNPSFDSGHLSSCLAFLSLFEVDSVLIVIFETSILQ